MYKFRYANKIVLDMDAPSALVVREKISPKELSEMVVAQGDAVRNYLDERIKNSEGLCKYFRITPENYSRLGNYERTIYDALEELKIQKAQTDKVKVIFDFSSIGKDDEGFDYLMSVLKSANFGEHKVQVCLQFIDEEAIINSGTPEILTKEELEKVKETERKLIDAGVVDRLYLQEGDEGVALTIEQVEAANKYIDVIVNEIRGMNLSPFEVAVHVHDKCSQFFYNWNNKLYGTNVLAEVIESGNIRCVGFATMYKAILDELNMPELQAKICGLFGTGREGHAVNIVSIKDEKYGIDGEYMQDACYSALAVDREKSDFMYCLYPIDDIPKMYNENYRVVENINLLSFYDLEHTHALRIGAMGKEKAEEFLSGSHKAFLDGINKKGSAIDVTKYAEAYFECLVKSGVSDEKAKEIVDKKINYTIARASVVLGDVQSKFSMADLTEEFLEENLSEYEFIDFGIKQFEKEDLDALPPEQKQEILNLLVKLRERRRELLMSEEDGNEKNRKIIKDILEKN